MTSQAKEFQPGLKDQAWIISCGEKKKNLKTNQKVVGHPHDSQVTTAPMGSSVVSHTAGPSG